MNRISRDEVFRLIDSHNPSKVNQFFRIAPKWIKEDKELVLYAILKKNLQLKNISPKLRDDEEIVLQAPHYENWLKYVSYRIMDNRNMVSLICGGPSDLEYVSARLRNDEDFIMHYIIHCDEACYKYASKRLRSNRRFAKRVLRSRPNVFAYFHDGFRDDKQLILYYLRQNVSRYGNTGGYGCMPLVSSRLRNDKNFIKEAVKIDYMTIKYVSPELQIDKLFILELLKIENRIYDCIACETKIYSDEHTIYIRHFPNRLFSQREIQLQSPSFNIMRDYRNLDMYLL